MQLGGGPAAVHESRGEKCIAEVIYFCTMALSYLINVTLASQHQPWVAQANLDSMNRLAILDLGHRVYWSTCHTRASNWCIKWQFEKLDATRRSSV